ncbi:MULTISPECIES: hypothetical protein [unclassified Lysobacter]|uniref:hypothetical protein n=1 Tax=unclassified Lysobacter TaxID=2635362 RepID=UPI001BE7851B|nr:MULTISPECIES: hypothetical protein [unclassified Lysobacter]MBT2746616.1 hypothetical protein [Lysobacter sp. ISL-42]MBT2753389.1 hypothetical protein [Lysobacter sp. ISL-50]MBT2775499.1 hypothetical protein [Lysobacter sp. ISL-54]MBT2782965.1 hypothetical protein [Lysobacter sp. ISL-52]
MTVSRRFFSPLLIVAGLLTTGSALAGESFTLSLSDGSVNTSKEEMIEVVRAQLVSACEAKGGTAGEFVVNGTYFDPSSEVQFVEGTITCHRN